MDLYSGGIAVSLNINNDNESDTAAYNDNKDTLSWDLKNSTRE